MARVLICDKISEKGIRLLEEKGFEVLNRPGISHEELKEAIEDVDAIVVRSRTKVTRDVIERAKKLKLIVRAGVGIDNIDVEAAKERGIKVLNTPAAPSDSVAELTIGLMLSLARRIPEADKKMKEGVWAKKELMGVQLKGKVLGIIGLGRIGYRVGRIAKAMGMKIIAYEPYPVKERVEELEAELVSLDELLRRADVVTIHVPLLPETRHMISERELSLMKPTAFLINTSRGEVVDEEALYKALKEGKIAGAALDVYSKEPPGDSPLVKLPNVVCTPHIGSQTKEAQDAAGVMAAELIIRELGNFK